jgi:hypothetical protein
MKVMREESVVEKRGSRNTGEGRQLGYLSIFELAIHSRIISKKHRLEKAFHVHSKHKLVQLRIYKPLFSKLEELEDGDSTDVMKFCINVVSAHRTNALGGKPAFWDFMKDVPTILNRKKGGCRYSENTKAFAQIMKIYGGRRMYDLFTLNFVGPSWSTVKCENQKGVQFTLGEHRQVSQSVAEVYRHAKLKCKVTGPIPVILAEDKTKVKSRVCWEQKWDSLAGFCGPKENHMCVPLYKVVVGSGESGYEKIVDSFQKDKIGGYARVIVVCSLHSALPRLVLSVTCTCGCFDFAWVRRQWDRIDMLWIEDCLDGIGPILGHASDGDSRRRQLMLADYLSDSGERYRMGWMVDVCMY